MAGLIVGIIALLQKLLCAPQQPQQTYPQQQQQQGQGQGQYYPQQPQGQQYYPPPQQWQQAPPHHQQQQQQQHHAPQHVNGDMEHADDPHYKSLRAQANEEGDKMAAAFDQAHEAHERGDGQAAHELSQEGHAHQSRMEQLNGEAAAWIFNANNASSPSGSIDLHGLYVAEAISRTESALQAAQAQGAPELRLIVGKGLHSKGHVAKIKPAIEDLMQKYRFAAELDPHNEGVLIVHLGGAAQGRGMDADEMTRRLDSGDKCVIM